MKPDAKKMIAALLVLMLTFLCGCPRPIPRVQNSAANNHRIDLYILFLYNVPFFPYGYRGTECIECSALEEDEHGRTLGKAVYNDRVNSWIAESGTYYCILQKGGSDSCTFYEDICCAYVANGEDPAKTISDLKEKNDWEKPMELSEAVTIPFRDSYFDAEYSLDAEENKYFVYYNAAKNRIAKEAPFDFSIDFMSKDREGRVFALIYVFSDSSTQEIGKIFLALFNNIERVQNNGRVFLMDSEITTLEDWKQPWDEIRQYKIDNGWNLPRIRGN